MLKRRLSAVVSLLLSLVLCFGFAVLPVGSEDANTAVASTSWQNSYTGTYYDNLNESLTGSEFRSELAELITTTHTTYTTYDELKNVFKVSDADSNKNGNIIWFYSGTSVSFSGFGSSNGATNREHVWPKDAGNAFPEKSGPGSDAHHLRPTEAQMNSIRGSKSFGEVEQTTSNIVKENGSTSYGNSENGKDALCYTSGNYFYPAKGYRGQTARILMYLQTRWGNQYSLQFVLGAGKTKTIGDIATLLKWHLEEPPTEEEIARNNAVAEIQGNRNPFIDHPEYAAQIYCYDGNSYNSALLDVLQNSNDPYGNLSDAQTVTAISVSGAPAKTVYTEGDTFDPTGLTVTAIYSDGTTEILSSGSCSWLDGTTGKTTLSAGTVSIVCNVKGITKSVSGITVLSKTQSDEGITLDKTLLELNVGDTFLLEATVSGGGNAVWITSESDVVTVAEDGTVTAVGEGTATVTAICSGKRAYCTVVVTAVKVIEPDVSEFTAAVARAKEAENFSNKFSSIQNAIEKYMNLSDEGKAAAADELAELLELIDEYNKAVRGYNNAMHSATGAV